jgi:sugar O-acyltransferase (sialic acid O-acetyltransferase NeuD family)
MAKKLIKARTAAKALTILGAGGHGRVVADIAGLLGYSPVEFVDRSFPARRRSLAWNIIGKDFAASGKGSVRFVAIGDNAQRLLALEALFAEGDEPPVLIHPAAIVSAHATLGAGTVVMPGAVINAGARLGRGVIANTGCSIDHDCDLADGVHVSPGGHIAGGVSIGRASWIGIGAVVRETVKIGANVMVGAGAAVIRDVPDGARVVGVPAR